MMSDSMKTSRRARRLHCFRSDAGRRSESSFRLGPKLADDSPGFDRLAEARLRRQESLPEIKANETRKAPRPPDGDSGQPWRSLSDCAGFLRLVRPQPFRQFVGEVFGMIRR